MVDRLLVVNNSWKYIIEKYWKVEICCDTAFEKVILKVVVSSSGIFFS